MEKFNHVKFDVENQIGILKIDNPKTLNALNEATLKEIKTVVEQINEEEVDIRFLIITGAGDKAFVAGIDIKELKGKTTLEGREFSELGNSTFNAISNLPIPTLAAVNGYALGGGLELALACDIRFASETVLAGLPELKLGLIPGFGGTQRLARTVGVAKAKELIFSSKNVEAEEGLEIGLFNQIFAQSHLMPEAKKYAETVIKRAPIATRFAKTAIDTGYELDLNRAIDFEKELFGSLFATEDTNEGLQAFVDKRQAKFKNK